MSDGRVGFGPFLDGQIDAAIDLQQHVYRRTEEALERWRLVDAALDSPAAVHARQEQIRQAVLAGIGGLPQTGTPLNVEWLGDVPADDYRIRRLVFTSLPEVFVTANLYVPASAGEGRPTAAVVFVCGHAEAGKAYPPYQAVCARLARAGLLALALDPIGQGERKSYLDPATGAEQVAWGTAEHSHAGLQCWWIGQSSARYFVHEVRRAVDLLTALPEVDPERIGITGNSGGGTITTLATVLEPRLAAAAPGTYVSGRGEYLWSGQAQDAEQIILGGTDAGVDHADLVSAAAPRPVLVLAADHDFFPLQATLESVDRARHAYALLGARDRLELVRTRAGHEYDPELATMATEFFVRRLGIGTSTDTDDRREPATLDPRALQCSRSGQILLDRPRSRRIFDLALAEHRDARVDTRSSVVRDWLSAQVHRHRRPGAELFARWRPETLVDSVRVRRVLWRPEVDVWNAGVALRRTSAGPVHVVCLVLTDGGTTTASTKDAPDSDDRVTVVVDVRGIGALAPRPVNPRPLDAVHGTMYKLTTDLLWLGDSLTAARVFDVLRAVDLAVSAPEIGLEPGGRVELVAHGRSALWGGLAAALDERIARVDLTAGPDADPSIDPLDVAAVVSDRLLGPGGPGPGGAGTHHWDSVLPGLAVRAPVEALRALLGRRRVEVVRPRA
ncbi:MAG TPA: acetylxylan esterase [Actinopolymorphaceae bacterium]